MRPDSSAPLTHPLRRAGVCVADGYGVKIFVRRGQLVVEDGLGRDRRSRVFARASHGIRRLVVLGSQGFISLEAVRWMADLGIALIHLDRDGRILTTSAGSAGDARLRRLQAAASTTTTGLELSRWLLRQKLQGQARVLILLDGVSTSAGVDLNIGALEAAETIAELVTAEREAALAYWSAWAPVEVTFSHRDARLVPDYWLRFGQRGSPLTSAPRLAINPANALLNYLYAILEAETRLACIAVGLDPGLGIVHVDYRSRDSFALDLMEAVRPDVDAYVLELLRSRTFTRRDFGETRRGVCRILPPLSHELAETAPHWASLIAPVVEETAKWLAAAEGSRVGRLGTPLTRTNRAAARRGSTPKRRSPKPPRLSAVCRQCGGPLPHRERAYCDDCLPHYQQEQYATAFHGSGLAAIERAKAKGKDPTHGAKAAAARAATNVERKREAREWDERYGKLTDLSAFKREILPLIQEVPLSRLQKATGLSLRYVSQIRRGEKTPHPRHWQALLAATSPAATGSALG
jgi:CRISPR-associated endonuclease Cas1